MFVKEVTVKDIPIIIELAMEVWQQTYVPILGQQQVDYMLDLFYSPDALAHQIEVLEHHFLIGYIYEKPVCFASIEEAENGIYKLHKLYVLPSEQGKGLGKFMIDCIITKIKFFNAKALMLNVNRYNQAAIAFYKIYGFTQLREEDIPIGNGYFMNDYVFSIAIPPLINFTQN